MQLLQKNRRTMDIQLIIKEKQRGEAQIDKNKKIERKHGVFQVYCECENIVNRNSKQLIRKKELSVTEKQAAYLSPSGNIGVLQRRIWKEMCTAKTVL